MAKTKLGALRESVAPTDVASVTAAKRGEGTARVFAVAASVMPADTTNPAASMAGRARLLVLDAEQAPDTADMLDVTADVESGSCSVLLDIDVKPGESFTFVPSVAFAVARSFVAVLTPIMDNTGAYVQTVCALTVQGEYVREKDVERFRLR